MTWSRIKKINFSIYLHEHGFLKRWKIGETFEIDGRMTDYKAVREKLNSNKLYFFPTRFRNAIYNVASAVKSTHKSIKKSAQFIAISRKKSWKNSNKFS